MALQLVEGSIDADSDTAAIDRLGSRGLFPITLTEALSTVTASHSAFRRRLTARTLAHMSRQLADLLGGGLTLFYALALLAEQTEDRTLRAIITDVAQAVHEGQSFSEALANHPHVFSPLYLSMIKAGETGGALEAVLGRLADLLTAQSEFRSRVLSALLYPLVVLSMGLITVVVLLTYVVPKLTILFAETGQVLPLPTRLLLGISDALSHGWWLWLIGWVAVLAGWRMGARNPAGRATVDRWILQTPLVGPLVRKSQTAQFTRNLGGMIAQGVPVLQALEVAGSTMANTILRRAVERMQQAVREGESVASALALTHQFPAFVGNLIAVGEESGTLDSALLKIAMSYERETERALRVLTTVLEPLLIVIVGVIVMFIVIAMLLPIFQLGLVAQ